MYARSGGNIPPKPIDPTTGGPVHPTPPPPPKPQPPAPPPLNPPKTGPSRRKRRPSTGQEG
ncbi:MAG: hypothetical protein ACUVS2_13980 [Candidatus Flexifilum sp.]|jgi:hypothetical protein